MKKIFVMIIMLAAFVLNGCNTQAAVNLSEKNVKGDLQISMLNIGHGDAILIRTKEQTILIDTAHSSRRDLFVKELEKLSVTKIDKLILTHPHSDHIGGASMLIKPGKKQLEAYPYLEKISVGEVYDNGVTYPSGFYKNYMKNGQATGITRHGLKVGDTLDFGGGVKFKVLFPTEEFVAERNSMQAEDIKKDREYKLNNSSLVGKLTYKNFSMMFTGDCEKESEEKIILSNNAKDLKCDVLKSGHHGIRTSSTKEFVAAVNPSVVLISAGNDITEVTTKSVPHARTLQVYLAQGIDAKNIFCTQWNGTITITSDGKNFSVKPEVKEDWIEDWIIKKREAGVK